MDDLNLAISGESLGISGESSGIPAVVYSQRRHINKAKTRNRMPAPPAPRGQMRGRGTGRMIDKIISLMDLPSVIAPYQIFRLAFCSKGEKMEVWPSLP